MQRKLVHERQMVQRQSTNDFRECRPDQSFEITSTQSSFSSTVSAACHRSAKAAEIFRLLFFRKSEMMRASRPHEGGASRSS
jgi:hypothetical protein